MSKDVRYSTVDETIDTRAKEYGDFSDMAAFAQEVEMVAMRYPGYALMTPVEREGLHMIIHKMGRMLAGNPHNRDNWHDIQGYAKMVEDRLPSSP